MTKKKEPTDEEPALEDKSALTSKYLRLLGLRKARTGGLLKILDS